MNWTYLGLELKRFFREPTSVFFVAVLPALLYVIFGAAQGYSAQSAGHGNVSMYVMLSMAAYGAVTATVGIGGGAAVERIQGWSRQLGLTPLKDSSFVLVKAMLGLVVAMVPVGLTFLVGAITGARGDARVWVIGALVALAGAGLFAIYGLIFGLMMRSEAAVGAATGSLVIFAFLGNLFFPLSGTLLTIAKFTPLYGYASLTRRALTDGYMVAVEETAPAVFEPLWQPILGVAVWSAIFIGMAVFAVRFSRRRQ